MKVACSRGSLDAENQCSQWSANKSSHVCGDKKSVHAVVSLHQQPQLTSAGPSPESDTPIFNSSTQLPSNPPPARIFFLYSRNSASHHECCGQLKTSLDGCVCMVYYHCLSAAVSHVPGEYRIGYYSVV